MKTMMKLTLIALCAMLSTRSQAQTAFEQLKLQAGDEAAARAADIQIPHAAIQPGGNLVSLPLNAKDVFAQCQAVDSKAMALVEWTLPQAVGVMQHCLDKSYGEAKGYAVTAKAAKFFVPMCAPAPGRMACQALKEVDGIEIAVEGRILTGDSVLSDLSYSVKHRDGKLLGYSATVVSEATILN